jgi:hypothetical protein
MPEFSVGFMAVAAGVAIALYLGFIGYGLLAPVKQRDPQMGMAVGCLTLLLIPGIVLAAMLAIGVIGHVEKLVRVTFWVTVIPIAWVLVGLAAQPIFWLKRRREARRWATPSDEPPQS